MAKQYIVKAGAVAARIGGFDRYFERGSVLPEGVENVEHLLAVGLVSAVDVPDPVEDTGPKPVDKMTKDELLAYAQEQGIDLGEAKNKPEVLAAIQAAAAPVIEGGGQTIEGGQGVVSGLPTVNAQPADNN